MRNTTTRLSYIAIAALAVLVTGCKPGLNPLTAFTTTLGGTGSEVDRGPGDYKFVQPKKPPPPKNPPLVGGFTGGPRIGPTPKPRPPTIGPYRPPPKPKPDRFNSTIGPAKPPPTLGRLLFPRRGPRPRSRIFMRSQVIEERNRGTDGGTRRVLFRPKPIVTTSTPQVQPTVPTIPIPPAATRPFTPPMPTFGH